MLLENSVTTPEVQPDFSADKTRKRRSFKVWLDFEDREYVKEQSSSLSASLSLPVSFEDTAALLIKRCRELNIDLKSDVAPIS